MPLIHACLYALGQLIWPDSNKATILKLVAAIRASAASSRSCTSLFRTGGALRISSSRGIRPVCRGQSSGRPVSPDASRSYEPTFAGLWPTASSRRPSFAASCWHSPPQAASRCRRGWGVRRVKQIGNGGHKLRRREGFGQRNAIREAPGRPILAMGPGHIDDGEHRVDLRTGPPPSRRSSRAN